MLIVEHVCWLGDFKGIDSTVYAIMRVRRCEHEKCLTVIFNIVILSCYVLTDCEYSSKRFDKICT